MSHVTFSPAAVADLDGIWDYTVEQWGLDQAEHYIDSIRDACIGLANGEKQGRIVGAREGYLQYAVMRHLVFFREVGAGVTVVRVLHQRMDPGRHL